MKEQRAYYLNTAEGMIHILSYLKKNKQFVSSIRAAVMYLQLSSLLAIGARAYVSCGTPIVSGIGGR